MEKIDTVRAFWDSRPCNIRHSKLPIGTKEYFDEVERRKYFVEPHIPGFAEFSNWKGKTVLELGMGIGTDAVNFVRAGADYSGLELSEESLKIARKRFEVFGLSGNLVSGDLESCANMFPLKTFDLIYSFGVIHHTPSIVRALSEIRKLAHQDSRIKVMVYASNSWKNALINSGFDQPEAQLGCPIANTYTKNEITLLFKNAGLSVTNIKQDHIFMYRIDKYIQYEYQLEPWFEVMPSDLRRSIEAELGWHLLIDAEILK
jgi:ubiquinone/menaquinone biosynthesis C-methylase UbiE